MKQVLLFTIFSILPSTIFSQLQIGSTLAGDTGGDLFGWEIATSANAEIMAIGAPAHADALGFVKVYNRTGTDWVQQGSVLQGDTAYSFFGTAVSLSANGEILAVAASGAANSEGENGAGIVKVFTWNGSDWEQMGADIEGASSEIYFGTSVALSSSGEYLAIGAPFNSANFLAMSGSVFIYSWNGSSWQADAEFDGEAAGDLFGYDLDISEDGNFLAVGAYRNHENGTLSGSVYVYEKSDSNWSLQGNPLHGNSLSSFGRKVDISADGQTLAVGAPSENNDAGSVYIYSWNGNNWEQKGQNIEGTNEERMGRAVALNQDGSILAVGAPYSHGYYGAETGKAQVYAWDGNNWNQQALDIEGMQAGNRCGNALAISFDGSIVAVGSYQSNIAGGNSGSVRVFEFCPPSMSSIAVTSCQSYTVPSGDTTYTESGIYVDEILNAASCGDSIITISLTIISIDTTVSLSGSSLIANQIASAYQWINCKSNTAIPGAVAQVFTPSESGTYSVALTANGCTDTSACHEVILVSANEQPFGEKLLFYPNPVSNGMLYVELGESCKSIDVFLRDETGKLLRHENFTATSNFSLDISSERKYEILFIELISSNGKRAVLKVSTYRE